MSGAVPNEIPVIVLATHNHNKAREIQGMLSGRYQVITMSEVGFTQEIEENAPNFTGNALLKAWAVHDYLKERGRHYIVVAEDSGLCVTALNDRPGVYTARYGGEGCSEHRQRLLLLDELRNGKDRSARFECTIVCIESEAGSCQVHTFTGQTFGQITTEERGANGFAFDQIFSSDDLGKTFAEATSEEKDSVSHRGKAIKQLCEYLQRNSE